MFVGQIERSTTGGEAFQEIDYKQCSDMPPSESSRLKMWIGFQKCQPRFSTAVNGRAGPVVVALPEDMLRDTTTARLSNCFDSGTSAECRAVGGSNKDLKLPESRS
ncbi:MAG: hypothetical protein CM1200mP18_09700 [Gammaproteobacteria bacterium]|nr:MAG: hypothetical protein CM1200mP18_09700 [Gammaproteobacteria bacterium]